MINEAAVRVIFVGLLDKISNRLANSINNGASTSRKVLSKGANFAFNGKRYFPDADLEFRGYQNGGHIHIGLYPKMIRIGERNIIGRAFGEGNIPASLNIVSYVGNSNKNIPMNYIGSIERIADGGMTIIRLHVVGSKNETFKMYPFDAKRVEEYILANRP